MPKNKPKWQTDKVWALRRANRKGKLPDEAESLFIGDPEFCFGYARALNSRLPEPLENSLIEELDDEKKYADRTVANWIISYKQYSPDIHPKLEKILLKRLKGHMGNRYDWATERALKYASLCENVPAVLEKELWANEHGAIRYVMQSGKRIPESLEAGIFSKFDDEDVVIYAKKIFKGRLPDNLENLLANMPDAALNYAKEVMLGRLPEQVHTAMVMKSFENNREVGSTVSDYLDFVKMTYNYVRSTLANFDKKDTVGDVLKSIGEEIEYQE